MPTVRGEGEEVVIVQRVDSVMKAFAGCCPTPPPAPHWAAS
jgi:hypothetical protein